MAQVPIISNVNPLNAKVGATLTLTGSNFNITASRNVVFFGATAAVATTATATTITVKVPAGATYAMLSVLNTQNNLTGSSKQYFNPTFSPNKGSITLNDLAAKKDFNIEGNASSVAIGDLDGDGKPDLVVTSSSSNTVSVFRNTSSSGSLDASSFTAKQDFTTGEYPVSVAIGDLDGNGKLDLVVANSSSNSVSVFRNTSSVGSINASSFTVKQDFATSFYPTFVAIGDLDRDGKPDLVVTNGSSNSVSLFRNSGSLNNINFAVKEDFDTGDGPQSVAIGDIDGDGKPDLAVANTYSSTVSVLRNNSSSGSITASSFAAKQDFSTGSYPYSVAIGDVDGDGKPDLVVTNGSSNTVSVFRNTSSSGNITASSFAAKQDFATGNYPSVVAIGDIDGDGKPDMAVANSFSNSVSVFRNTSNLSNINFAFKQDFATGNFTQSVAIGDLDGDGKPDLAVANFSSNSVSILGNHSQYAPIITSVSPLNAAVGTNLTLTGSNFNATASNNVVFFGATAAVATAVTANTITVKVPVGATYSMLTVLNTQNNLMGSSKQYFNPTFSPNKGSISLNDLAAKQDFTTGEFPSSVAIGDIDGDGKPDLVVANYSTNVVSVFRNTSSSGSLNASSFTAKQDFTTGLQPQSVAIGDVDGDGKLDLVVANPGSNTVSVFHNTSSLGSIDASSFAAKQDFITSTNPISVAIGDVDGDGRPDLVVANVNANSVSVFRNTSSSGSINAASFAAKQDFIAGTQPQLVAIGDVDGDGKPDLIVTNTGSNTVSVFRNTSSLGSIDASSFTAKQDFTTGTSPTSVAIGDLDGDGKPDLVVTNLSSNRVSVFHNTSSLGSIDASSFAARQDFTTGIAPSSVAIGDIDGDGKPDLVVAAKNISNLVTVFRNTSVQGIINAASFSTKQDFTAGSYPTSVAVGDVDGDGKPDLVVANENSVSVLRNNPQIVTLPVSFGTFTADLQYNSVKLAWNTLSETNNKGFLIEKSIDGINFSTLAFLDSKGTNANTYALYDNSPANGTNYYRLIQQDNDGKENELGVRHVIFSLTSSIVKIHPNPTENHVSLKFLPNYFTNLRVTDLNGKVLQHTTINATEGSKEISLGAYPAGVYIITLGGKDNAESHKIVKK
ncbi:FG-GAP-like repeat-containing protein [uncultured Pedobacter sp.]|nr:FG-GAP-like repeat-containing protein [uncultured Pedobacter sp.]